MHGGTQRSAVPVALAALGVLALLVVPGPADPSPVTPVAAVRAAAVEEPRPRSGCDRPGRSPCAGWPAPRRRCPPAASRPWPPTGGGAPRVRGPAGWPGSTRASLDGVRADRSPGLGPPRRPPPTRPRPARRRHRDPRPGLPAADRLRSWRPAARPHRRRRRPRPGGGHPGRPLGAGCARAAQLGRSARGGDRDRRQHGQPRAAARCRRPRIRPGGRDGRLAGCGRSRWPTPRTVAHLLVRPDGSTVHVARLDERTGEVRWAGTVQGMRDGVDLGARPVLGGARLHHRLAREPRPGDARRRAARRPGGRWPTCPPTGVPAWDSAGDGAAGRLGRGRPRLGAARAGPDRPGSRAPGGPGPGPAGASCTPWPARPTSRPAPPRPALLRHVRHSPEHPDVGTSYADLYLLEALQRDQLLPSPRPVLRVVGRRDPVPATRVLEPRPGPRRVRRIGALGRRRDRSR